MEELYGRRVMSVHPPLGLAYLASYLQKKEISVEILDANALNLSEGEIVKRVVNSESKFIGIGSTSAIAEISFRLCEKIKRESPFKVIIYGGIHISCLTEDSLRKCPAIDYAVIGEGEFILYNLIKAIKAGKTIKKIKGVAFINKKGKFIQTQAEDLIENLNVLPFPARDLLPTHLYRPSSEFDMGFRGKEYQISCSLGFD